MLAETPTVLLSLLSIMSHHLFVLSPSDSPLYSMTHQSSKPAPSTAYPLAANLPSWGSSAFAGTFAALSGATSAAYNQTPNATTAAVRLAGQNKHVVQMIAWASLDVVEDVVKRDNGMLVGLLLYGFLQYGTGYEMHEYIVGISKRWISSTNGQCLHLLRQGVGPRLTQSKIRTSLISPVLLILPEWIYRYEVYSTARGEE